MRAEKQLIGQEYLVRLNSSPFFIVADYRGLSVGHFNELRKRLAKAGADLHVVKNSLFRLAVKTAGIADLAGSLDGQLAVVTGRQDVSVAAKVLKTYRAEFDKPKIRFGFLNNQRLDVDQLNVLADLPPLEVLRGRLLGVIQAPASQLVRVLAAPAQQVARVLQARQEKMEKVSSE